LCKGGLTKLQAVICFERDRSAVVLAIQSLSAQPDGVSRFTPVLHVPVINVNIRCGTIGIPVCFL
jgi:hypothetical protein